MVHMLLIVTGAALISCQSPSKPHNALHTVEYVIPAETQSVCTNANLDIGFVSCREIFVSACGVTLRECSGGASYYCLRDLICEPKSEEEIEQDLFDQ